MIQLIKWLKRKRKVLHGVYRTYIKNERGQYNPVGWYDDKQYAKGISDRQTITERTKLITSSYHYASIERIILKELCNSEIEINERRVLDIGSGAGHWLKFYKLLGAKLCVGIDVSTISTEWIEKNVASEEIEIHCGLFQDILRRDKRKYDVINAIGVLFHVVDDSDWMDGLAAIANSLKEGGLLIVGGHFGLINKVNVDYDSDKLAYKRLRSKQHWNKTLKQFGFKETKVRKNYGYLHIKAYVPENNILFAWR